MRRYIRRFSVFAAAGVLSLSLFAMPSFASTADALPNCQRIDRLREDRIPEGEEFKVRCSVSISKENKVSVRNDEINSVGVDMFKYISLEKDGDGVILTIMAKEHSRYRWDLFNWGKLVLVEDGIDVARSSRYIGVKSDVSKKPAKSPGQIAGEFGPACNGGDNKPECKKLVKETSRDYLPDRFKAEAAPDGRKKDPEAEEITVIVVEPPKITVIIDGEEQRPQEQHENQQQDGAPQEVVQPQPVEEPIPEPKPQPVVETTPEPTPEPKKECLSHDEVNRRIAAIVAQMWPNVDKETIDNPVGEMQKIKARRC